jgi:PKD repeat protein
MQGPAMNAGMPFSIQSWQQSRRNGQRRTWILLFVILLVIALVATGMSWLQWAAQRGLSQGYPRPVVQLTTQTSGTLLLNQSYQFGANAQGRDLTYSWDFGDQSSASGAAVNHAFQSNGNYTVSVTVTDPLGQRNTASTQVSVLPPPPQATFSFSVGYYSYVSFDASNSSADSSTSIAYYDWNFGDGTTDHTSYSQDAHTYSYSGSYTVTLTITDATGQQSTPYQAVVVI